MKKKKSDRGKNTRINNKLNPTKSDIEAHTQPDTWSWRERQKRKDKTHSEKKHRQYTHDNINSDTVAHTELDTQTWGER